MTENKGIQGTARENEETKPPSSFVFRCLPWSSLVFRIIVGGVLIYSGFSKAVGPAAEFAAALAAYKLLPHAAIMPIAQVWPWLELLAGTYILAGFYTRIGARIGH